MTAAAPARPVRSAQRYIRRNPCPICGGHADLPQGHGERCWGFTSADGDYAHCMREQYAGHLEPGLDGAFAHRLRGECKCGASHGPAPSATPVTRPAQRLAPVETRYELRAAAGHLMGVHGRRDYLDSAGRPYRNKTMWWERHDGRSPAHMPLYNLAAHLTAPADALRILCEGERAADALAAAIQREQLAERVVALGTVTGAAAVPCDDSLRPLVGVPVALWADNDAVGRRHMERIAARRVALGAPDAPAPRWITVPGAQPKADAADYFAALGTVERVLDQLATERRQSSGGEGDHHPNDHLSTEWAGGELLSDVTPECVTWLWGGYIPLRKLTIADGDPGLGKTMLYAADLAARVTTGAVMPDGTPGIPGGAGVVIFTAEDDPADTLQPRLVAAAGDLSKVLVVTTIRRPASDPDSQPSAMIERLPTFADVTFIEQAIARVKAQLVIFDPFMAYLPSTVNSFRDQDVRAALAPLARMAQQNGAAFVLIRHLNKGNFANALYRGGGSIGIIGAARAGLLVVKDPDDENRRIFGPTKSNLGPLMPSWHYRITADDHLSDVPHIQWEGQSERSAQELLNLPGERDTLSKLETACGLLREVLGDGPQPEKDVCAAAKAQGISHPTLRRAKDMLGVLSARTGGVGTEGYWVWSLPAIVKGDQDSRYGDHPLDDDRLSKNLGAKPAQHAALSKGDHPDGDDHLSAADDHLSDTDSRAHDEPAYPSPPGDLRWSGPQDRWEREHESARQNDQQNDQQNDGNRARALARQGVTP